MLVAVEPHDRLQLVELVFAQPAKVASGE